MSKEKSRSESKSALADPNSPDFLEGVVHFFTETGTEGGYWAFQENKFMKENTTMFSCTKCHYFWDKERHPQGPEVPCTKGGQHEFVINPPMFFLGEGLHTLKDGDYLVIYSKDRSRVVWSGHILLKKYPVFRENAFGFWIHADQQGIKREVWAKYFFDELPAKLVVAPNLKQE